MRDVKYTSGLIRCFCCWIECNGHRSRRAVERALVASLDLSCSSLSIQPPCIFQLGVFPPLVFAITSLLCSLNPKDLKLCFVVPLSVSSCCADNVGREPINCLGPQLFSKWLLCYLVHECNIARGLSSYADWYFLTSQDFMAGIRGKHLPPWTRPPLKDVLSREIWLIA